MLFEILVSAILILVLFINMYFTYLLNRKMKALREYTKKLPDLVSYVQKTMEVFGKSLHELKETGGKIQSDVTSKIEEAKDLTEDNKDSEPMLVEIRTGMKNYFVFIYFVFYKAD